MGSYGSYPFNEEWVGWQFGSWASSAGYDFTQLEITIAYTGNCNVSKFTNIFLHREKFGVSFGYENGNVYSTSNLAGQKSDIKYDSADNVTSYVQPGRDKDVADNQHWAYYGSTDADKNKHLPWRTRTPMHMTDYFTYDSYGNPMNARRVNYAVYSSGAAENANPYIRTENTYTADGNYPAATKDDRGFAYTKNHNLRDGTLASITDADGLTINYAYDGSRRASTAKTTADGKTYQNAYAYENDQIKTVSHNTTSDTANDVTYTFGYDELGNQTAIKVGTQLLSTRVYTSDRSKRLSEIQFANGGKVKNQYDEYDRITGVFYDNASSPRFAYSYGANGDAAKVVDSALDRTVSMDYDLANRLCETEIFDNGAESKIYGSKLKYDKQNNLSQFSETIGTTTYNSKYAYDRDNRITGIMFDGGSYKLGYTYDAIGRTAARSVETGNAAGKLVSTYGYVQGGYGTNSTSMLVSSIAQNKIAFSYLYDNCGSITSATRNGIATTYAYDGLGQLTRTNDPVANATWVYVYDRGGNIVSKSRYAYTTGTLGAVLETISYAYGDSNWKDKLTAYNGQNISYDAIGNPIGDGTWSYTWAGGHYLKRMQNAGSTVDFEYDHNGLRVGKVSTQNSTTVTTKYMLHGKLITHMTQGAASLHFWYDADSRPAVVDYNGTKYTYLLNVQGDVVGLLDSDGQLVVEYHYNEWGAPIQTTGTLASTLGKLNPFRYRSYVYDEETGLYYQEARYYNPVWQRFISADQVIANSNDLLMHNVFAYCANRPIMYVDRNGMWLDTFFDVVSLVSSIVEVALTPTNPVAWAALAADVVSLVVPGVTGGGKIVRLVCKAEDALDVIKMADKVVDSSKAVKSTKALGTTIHKSYKPIVKTGKNLINEVIEGTLKRPDAIDYVGKVVYELKPHNVRSLKAGLKQAHNYATLASGGNVKGWTIVVDLYMK